MNDHKKAILRHLENVLLTTVQPLFHPDYNVTIMAHKPGEPESAVLITNENSETAASAVDALRMGLARPDIREIVG